MTRKRYVKLLMGHGYSRNRANLCAERALAGGRSFRQDYNILLVGIGLADGFRAGCEAIGNAFAALAVEMEKLWDSFDAFAEKYRAAMDKEKEPEG